MLEVNESPQKVFLINMDKFKCHMVYDVGRPHMFCLKSGLPVYTSLSLVHDWSTYVLKGHCMGLNLAPTRNGKIWPTHKRQHRQYLKISC